MLCNYQEIEAELAGATAERAELMLKIENIRGVQRSIDLVEQAKTVADQEHRYVLNFVWGSDGMRIRVQISGVD